MGHNEDRHALCDRCGSLHFHPIGPVFCCMFAPKPTGWCAYCGENVKPGRVFCDAKCASLWFNDSGLRDETGVPACATKKHSVQY